MQDFDNNITYIQITNACNAQCQMCDIWQQPTYHMALQDVFKHLDNVSCFFPKSEIRLTGGEPCLHPNYQHIVQGAKERGLSVSIITNGTLFQTLFKARDLRRIFLSIDSPNKEDQFNIRKKNIDEDIIPQNVRIIANVVLSSLNKTMAPHIPDWMKKNGIKIINLIPMKSQKFMLCENELFSLISQILKICYLYNITCFVEGTNPNGIQPLLALEAILSKKTLKICKIRKKVQFININGLRYHCNSMPHRSKVPSVESEYCPDCPAYTNGLCDFSNIIYNCLNERGAL